MKISMLTGIACLLLPGCQTFDKTLKAFPKDKVAAVNSINGLDA